MNECIFCKVVTGEIPATKVFEDEKTIAFMDINPLYPGHTLVVSKAHYEFLAETPDNLLQILIIVVKKVAKAVMIETDSDGFNLLQNNHRCAGQSVPHIHFHIIPRKLGDRSWFLWKPGRASNADLEKMGEALRRRLAQEK